MNVTSAPSSDTITLFHTSLFYTFATYRLLLDLFTDLTFIETFEKELLKVLFLTQVNGFSLICSTSPFLNKSGLLKIKYLKKFV